MAKKKPKPHPKPVPIASAANRRSKYQKWRRWFKDVKNQIIDIAHRRRIYREVMEMIDANPNLKVPSAFYDWMRSAYVYDVTLAIRRLGDKDKRSISLFNLMDEIAAHPEVMTRRRFVANYGGWLRDAGHRDFDRFASPMAKRIHRRVIRRHQRELVAAERRLRRFVNKHVAHRSKHPMRRLPTYAELDTCIDLLVRLVKEYALLLEQAGLVEVVPVIQYDWKKPFRVAWITS